ncbi:MAG: hypothetical protein ACREMI_06685 [Gemmatimonadales bacterium]
MKTLLLVGLAACAPSILPVTPSTATRVDVAPPATQADSASHATIEVRYYAHSPTVTIVGWDAGDAGYGLRAWLRRDGSLIEDHRLYVGTYYPRRRPVFTRAMASSRPVRLTGVSRDVHACVGGKPCSPLETFGALISDELLRSNLDSIPVTFYDRGERVLVITLRRDLIDAYLGRLDSVVAVMRKKPS